MIDVTEQAKQAYKSAIIGYLRERCKTDTYLAEACKKENKTLAGLVSYIVEEARKQAENNVACIPDEEVYEWAVHYILEDSLNCEPSLKDVPAESVADDVDVKAEEVPEVKEAPKAKKSKKTIADECQLNLF